MKRTLELLFLLLLLAALPLVILCDKLEERRRIR